MREFGSADLGAGFLRKNDPLCNDPLCDSVIDAAIHAAIYLTENQEFNSHDRLMVDVPKNGRRKGGTHGLPPELRRTRSAKIVNEQLLRWNAPEEECLEAERFYHAVNAKIARRAAYVLSRYAGPHADVLTLRLQGKSTKEIADSLSKTTRRIRQIINGNAQRNEKGLHQIIDELMQAGVPTDFQSDAPAPVLVQPVHTLKKGLQKGAALGQLGWDFEVLSVNEVAA
ncbi:MAG: hypothetical protein ACYCPA_03565 [Acidithiobacillus sp.]